MNQTVCKHNQLLEINQRAISDCVTDTGTTASTGPIGSPYTNPLSPATCDEGCEADTALSIQKHVPNEPYVPSNKKTSRNNSFSFYCIQYMFWHIFSPSSGS
jgi:hypothetical protein